jgi:hypothetical protein
MWLHIPCGFSPSVQASECTTLHSEQSSLLEQCVTSSGKHTPRRSWLASWKRNAWMRRLSGLTLPPSTLDRGAESWMQSLRDSRANPTALRESGSATATSEHTEKATDPSCTSSESCPSVDPPWSSSRTSQLGLLGDGFDLSVMNYAAWVTRSKIRSFSVQTMLARRISGFASGSWPTSRAEDSESCGNHGEAADALNAVAKQWLTPDATLAPKRSGVERKASGATFSRQDPTFSQQAENWPTPDAAATTRSNRSPSRGAAARPALAALTPQWSTPQSHDIKNVEHETSFKNLPAEVKNWPSPATRDEKGANSESHATVTGGGRKHMDQLSNFVAYSHQVQRTPDGEGSSKNTHGSRPRLNPAFTAWLMGLTWWWTHPDVTSCVRSEMAEYRFALRSLGEYLLEGCSE